MLNIKKNIVFICEWVLAIVLLILFLVVSGLKLNVRFEMDNYPEVGVAKLYFDNGNGMNAQDVLSSIDYEDVLTFSVSAWEYTQINDLRFDPINFMCDVTIKKVSLYIGNHEVYSFTGREFLISTPAYAGINEFEISDEAGKVICENNTPIIFFDQSVVEQYNYYHRTLQIIAGIGIAGCFLTIILMIFIWRRGNDITNNVVYDRLCNPTHKKAFLLVSFVIYIVTRIIVLINYQGYYFNDEFYFMAEANPDYVSSYNRAPYVAALIKLFTSIAGNQYYAVKAVPLFCGIISFSCCMYLIFRLCETSASVLLAGFLMSFHALFVFNDFYIRMYSFQQMELMFLAVVLYKAKCSDDKKKKALWIMAGLGLASGVSIYTQDISGKIPFITYLCALTYLLVGERIVETIKCSKRRKLITVFVIISVIAVIGLLLSIKSGVLIDGAEINNGLIKEMIRLATSFRIENSAVISKYMLVDQMFFSFSYVAAGFVMLKRKSDKLGPIFILALIPMFVFCVLLYDARIVRTFIGYIFLMIVPVVWYWDVLLKKGKYLILVYTACALTLICSPVDMGWKEFKNQLYLYHEVFFCDYGKLMKDAAALRQNGYKVVALFGGTQVLAYFEFEPDFNLCTWDNDQNFNYTNDELLSILEQIQKSGEEYVIVMDKVGADKLHEIGVYYDLLEQYGYQIYNRNIELNCLYLVNIG